MRYFLIPIHSRYYSKSEDSSRRASLRSASSRYEGNIALAMFAWLPRAALALKQQMGFGR